MDTLNQTVCKISKFLLQNNNNNNNNNNNSKYSTDGDMAINTISQFIYVNITCKGKHFDINKGQSCVILYRQFKTKNL